MCSSIVSHFHIPEEEEDRPSPLSGRVSSISCSTLKTLDKQPIGRISFGAVTVGSEKVVERKVTNPFQFRVVLQRIEVESSNGERLSHSSILPVAYSSPYAKKSKRRSPLSGTHDFNDDPYVRSSGGGLMETTGKVYSILDHPMLPLSLERGDSFTFLVEFTPVCSGECHGNVIFMFSPSHRLPHIVVHGRGVASSLSDFEKSASKGRSSFQDPSRDSLIKRSSPSSPSPSSFDSPSGVNGTRSLHSKYLIDPSASRITSPAFKIDGFKEIYERTKQERIRFKQKMGEVSCPITLKDEHSHVVCPTYEID
jgi:hypothetical protein